MHGPATGIHAIDFFGFPLQLLPERAVFWEAEGILFVADLHIGKEATFRHAGLPVPDLLRDDLKRLSSAINRTGSTSLVILGDFYHASRGRTRRVNAEVARWRAAHSELKIHLIRGNHDRHAGDPYQELDIVLHDDPGTMGRLNLAHIPRFQATTPTLAGHLHPKYCLRCGAEKLKLPCFLQRQKTLVLPAFSNFVDHGLIRRQPGDAISVIAEDAVLTIPERQLS